MTHASSWIRPFLSIFIMMLAVSPSLRRTVTRHVFVGASSAPSSTVASESASSTTSTNSRQVFRTVQVQIVHRHGDRSPITPLKNEDYWSQTLVSKETLERISSNTKLVQNEDHEANTHNAGGRGPFGKLSELGLLQMVEVGTTLRELLSTTKEDPEARLVNDPGTDTWYDPYVWNPDRPLKPPNLRVISTDFARTIQSVQGLLVGLFPEPTEEIIPIDVRHTSWMIPDPQPRRSVEQSALETALSQRPHILQRERDLLPLAIRATEALHPLLADDAREATFGVAQEALEDMSIEIEPLSWNQLSEISKCLSVRDMLPEGLSPEDQETISQHAAWRWFELLTHPRLAYLAMHTMVKNQVDFFVNHHNEPPVTVWSAHDSTLIGLMCAYRLEQPAVWPEYGSYLLLELLENKEAKEYFVRFSLNGEHLRSQWEGDDEPRDMIPLDVLYDKVQTVGADEVYTEL